MVDANMNANIKTVLYYGGLWPTNMGNSFIDIGALHILKNVFPNAVIFHSSRFSSFYAQHRSKTQYLGFQNEWNPFDIAEHANVDAVVVAGNIAHSEFVKIEGPHIKSLVERGAKFIILGGGCSTYDHQERLTFRSFMKDAEAWAFISRDNSTFEAYGDCAKYSHSGIDCAFFLPDAVIPIPLTLNDYDVCSFDDQKFEKELHLKNRKIIRTRHYHFGIRERFIKKLSNTLISDLPLDFISLYAQAQNIFSDRVHVCVAGLAFGKNTRLFSKTPRAELFSRIGSGSVLNELTTLDNENLNKLKEQEMSFLIKSLR